MDYYLPAYGFEEYLMESRMRLHDWVSDFLQPHGEMESVFPVFSNEVLFVGNIPPNVPGEELLEFLNQTLLLADQSRGTGDAAIAFRMNIDKNYCYVQFRSEYDAQQALELDNISFRGHRLNIKPAHAAQLGGGPYGMPDDAGDEGEEGQDWGQRIVRYNPDTPGPSRGKKKKQQQQQHHQHQQQQHQHQKQQQPAPADDVDPCTLQSCKLRVRNIPSDVSEAEITEFFNMLMKFAGKTALDPVVSCRITNNVAIVQFRSPEDAEEALGFDSIKFKGTNLAIERVSAEPMKGLAGAGSAAGGAAAKGHERGGDEGDEGEESGDEGEEDEPEKPEDNEEAADIIPDKNTAEFHDDPTYQLIVENLMGGYPKVIMKHFNTMMKRRNLAMKPGDPIIGAKKVHQDTFTIIQFRSIQEATAALALDGVNFRGRLIKVSHPYNKGVQEVNKLLLSNLPRNVNRKPLRLFLNRQLHKKGLASGDRPVLNITRPKMRSSFQLQFRSKEEATSGLQLDGMIYFSSEKLVFRRPDEYWNTAEGAAGKRGPTPPLVNEGFAHVLVSGYPRGRTEEDVRAFLNLEMRARCLIRFPGDAFWPSKIPSSVVSTNCAFVKLRSPEEATQALKLQGAELKGQRITVNRPQGYKRQAPGETSKEPPKELPPVPAHHMTRKARKRRKNNSDEAANGPQYVRGLPQDPSYDVFVSNLAVGVTQDELRQFINKEMKDRGLTPFHAVRSVVMNAGRKACVFQVRSHMEAMAAVTSLNLVEFEGKKLVLEMFDPSAPKGSKKKRNKFVPGRGLMPNNPVAMMPPMPSMPPMVSRPDPMPTLSQEPPYKRQRQGWLDEKPSSYQGPPQRSMQQPFQPRQLSAASPMYERQMVRTPQVSYHSYQQEPPPSQSYGSSSSTYQANSLAGKLTWSIATWDVMGICADLEMQYYMDEKLNALGMDVIAIQETGLPSSTMYTKHYKWYLSGPETGKSAGVGILVRRDLLPAVYEWNPTSPHLAHMQLRTANNNLALVTALAPPPEATEAGTIFNELRTLVATFCPEDHIMVMGNLNAEVGKSELAPEDDWWVGPFVAHQRSNENGKKLKELLHKSRLFLYSTQWDTTMVTWSDGRSFAQIDHVMANCARLITSVRDIPMSSFSTYHKLLRASVRFTVCDLHPVFV